MIKISFRSNFPLLSSSSQKEAFCPRWVAFIVAEKISTFNRNWYPMFPFTKKMCLQNNQKTTRVFYSFLHVWWRGMIKKTWVSAQIEEKQLPPNNLIEKKLGFHPLTRKWAVIWFYLLLGRCREAIKHCHAESTSSLWNWSTWVDVFHLPVFFAILFFLVLENLLGQEFEIVSIWKNVGFLWIIGFHVGKFQSKLKSLRSRWFQETTMKWIPACEYA